MPVTDSGCFDNLDDSIKYLGKIDNFLPGFSLYSSHNYLSPDWEGIVMNKQRRIFLKLFAVISLLFVLFQGQVLAAASWSFIDGGLVTGINGNTNNNAFDPVMAVYNNELYAAWIENSGSVTLIQVKKYDGTSWSTVTGANGLNRDPTKSALHPAIAVFNGNLYVAWDEFNGSYTAIRVRKYDGGTTWTQVDGNTDQGLNRVATPSSNPSMVVYNGELYLSWENTISTVSYIHVKKYVSGATWSFVDGDTDTGLNYDITKNGLRPNLAVCNNQLYLAWTEKNSSAIQQIRVCQYSGGNSWTFIDGNGINGLNLSSSKNANAPWLMSLNNTLYAAWDEPDAVGNELSHLIKYNGISWTFVDGSYLNRANDLYAYSPKMVVLNNNAYITWDEEDQVSTYITQIRVKKFDGSTFSFIDGGLPSSQLNKDNTKHAKTPFPVIFKGDLCVAWYENNGTADQIRVKKYPLPPIVNSVSVPANNSYYAGQNLDFTVNFNKPVEVTGTPVIPITLNSGTKNAAYQSGAGTTALNFRYTVAEGDFDNNGITLNSSITLSGGTIREPVNSLDAEINLNNQASSIGVLVDAIVPTVSSVGVPPNSTYTADQKLTFTVTFSEVVTVVTTSGTPYIPITLNTGGVVNASYASGSGTTALIFSYTVISGDNDNDGIAAGTSIIANGGTLKDATGNNAVLTFALGSTAGVLVDAVGPSAVITSSAANPTNLSPIPVTITFSESAGGFTIEDITVTNGTAGSFSGTGTTYSALITPSGQGTVTVNVASGVAQDIAGNSNTAATAISRTFDNLAPTISISSSTAALTNVSPIPVTFTFSETVSGFLIGDITVTNGTAGNFSGTGTTYSALIAPSGQGVITVNVAADVAQDAAGNYNTAAIELSRTITVPGSVSLLYPIVNDTINTDSTLVVWLKENPNVLKYQVDISSDSLFVNVISDSGVTDTLKTLRDLTNKTKYWWRVRARNSEGWGAFSSTGSFFIKKPIGNIILTGLSASDQVYLNATQGWYGTVLSKKDTIKDLLSGRYYYLSVRAAGKRPHLVNVPVAAGRDTVVSITMKNAVALNFSDTVKIEQRPGVQMSLGSAACVVMDDINSDGSNDIIAGFRDGSVYFYLYKSGEYIFEKSMAVTGVLRYIRVIDFTSDGKPDLALAFENGAIAFYSQQPNLTFSPEPGNLQLGSGLAGFDYEDFDYDGVAEIVTGSTDGTISIATKSGGQYIVNQVVLDSSTPCNVGNVSGIEAVDISGDGNADIIAAVSDGTFKWFKNIGSRGFTAMGSIVSNGKPLSLGISPSISSVYGSNTFLPSLLIVNNTGLAYKVQGQLEGDFNGDGIVNTVDFGIFTDAWRSKQGDSNWNTKVNMDLTADPLNGQQIINLSDFGRFVDVWRNEQ